MRFSYTPVRTVAPVISLGGRSARPRPIVSTTVVGLTNAKAVDAYVDTGSDETLFDERIAATLGVDLSNAPSVACVGMGGHVCTARFALVTLRLTDGIEFREWPAWVGFVAGLQRSVPGFGGCLRFFTATFHGDTEFVDLAVNTIYPGT